MPPAAVPLRVSFAPLVGARWAGLLCAALLLGFALLAGRLWLGPGSGRETCVQQPVGPADFSPPLVPHPLLPTRETIYENCPRPDFALRPKLALSLCARADGGVRGGNSFHRRHGEAPARRNHPRHGSGGLHRLPRDPLRPGQDAPSAYPRRPALSARQRGARETGPGERHPGPSTLSWSTCTPSRRPSPNRT